MKKLKWVIIILLGLPCLLIVGFVVFQLVGMGINHSATAAQCKKLEQTIEATIPDVQILDFYSETGNTSGTGNHVDMLSVALIQTKEDILVVQNRLKEHYPLEKGTFYLQKAEAIKQEYEKMGTPYFYDKLKFPEDTQACYVVSLCKAAPFRDNIEGH